MLGGHTSSVTHEKLGFEKLKWVFECRSIMESLIFLCFFVSVDWQINKELKIGGISQFAMSRLRRKHHLNVDV
jgi:hypothetical protein